MPFGENLKRKLNTAVTDLHYGALLLSNGETGLKHLGVTGTVNSGYDVLPGIFSGHVRKGEVLVDVGCGRGRVLNWWLDNFREHRIYGIEIDSKLAEKTRHRLRRFANVTILTGDACEILPEDGSLFYVYNPFERNVMRRFIEAILRQPMSRNGLPRRILYYNSIDVALFEQTGAFSIVALKPAHSFAAMIECIEPQ